MHIKKPAIRLQFDLFSNNAYRLRSHVASGSAAVYTVKRLTTALHLCCYNSTLLIATVKSVSQLPAVLFIIPYSSSLQQLTPGSATRIRCVVRAVRSSPLCHLARQVACSHARPDSTRTGICAQGKWHCAAVAHSTLLATDVVEAQHTQLQASRQSVAAQHARCFASQQVSSQCRSCVYSDGGCASCAITRAMILSTAAHATIL